MTKRIPRIGGRRVGGRDLSTNALVLPVHTVANAPSAAGKAGQMIYMSNGAAGAVMAVFSDGTNWKRADTGATAAAS